MDDLQALILGTLERLLDDWQATWGQAADTVETNRLWSAIGGTGLFGALTTPDAEDPGSNPDFIFEFMTRWGQYAGPGIGLTTLIGGRTLLVDTAAADLLAQIADGSVRLALGVSAPEPALQRFDAQPGSKPDRIKLDAVQILRDASFATHALLTGSVGTEPVIICTRICALDLSEPFSLIDGSSAASLKVSEITLDEAQILHRGPLAHSTWSQAMARMTAAAACEAVGLLRAVLQQTATYVRQRKQFGQTIGSFQSVQHRMADMLVDVEQAHSLALAAIRTPDDGAVVSAAKARANRSLQFVTNQAVQLHGGIGTTQELMLSRYFRRAIVLAGEFGTTPAHLERVEAHLHARIHREVAA